MEPQIYLLSALASLLMGATLGVFGAGGSILTVPLLVFLLGIDPSHATHYSLFIVACVSGFGLFFDQKNNNIPINTLAQFTLPAMIGMFCMRNILLPSLPKQIFGTIMLNQFILFVFALFMILAAFSMIFIKVKSNSIKTQKSWRKISMLAFVGFLVGLATGFVGAGGGFLIVPALVFLGGFAVTEAASASLSVIMLNSFWGFFTTKTQWHEVPWSILLLVILAALGGMLLGLRLKGSMKADTLKPAFGVFVLLMGSYVLWKSI